jgi:hypothetical protein
MIERMALLEQQVDDEEYWRPVEVGLRRIWSRYSINSLEFENNLQSLPHFGAKSIRRSTALQVTKL